MKVAISGSTGLIGEAVCAALTERGDEVIRLVRRGSRGVAWDPAAGTIDIAGLEGIDAAIHLSGQRVRAGRWTAGHKRELFDSRVDSTRVLVDALVALDRPPAVLVSASAVGFYGDRGDEELTEDSTPGTGFMAELCQAWEEAAAPARSAGIRVANARTGLVLDRREGLLPKFLMPFGLAVAGRLGSGRQWMSWISLHDEVRGLLHLLDHDVSGPVNLTAPAPVRNAEFVRTLRAVRRRPSLPPVPAFALRALFGAEAARETALISQRVLPGRLPSSGFEFQHADLETALRSIFAR